jgi:hypothetical protein
MNLTIKGQKRWQGTNVPPQEGPRK